MKWTDSTRIKNIVVPGLYILGAIILILGLAAFNLWMHGDSYDWEKAQREHKPNITYIDPVPKELRTYQTFQSWAGYYMRNKIIIRPNQTANLQEYLQVATHEYGHYVMDRYLSSQDLKDYLKAYNTCNKSSSSYVDTFRSKSVKVTEDFAESYRLVLFNETVCPAKERIIKKYAAYKIQVS